MLMQTLHLANHSFFCLRLPGNGRRTSPWTSPHLIRWACQAEWTKSSWAGQQDKAAKAGGWREKETRQSLARCTHPTQTWPDSSIPRQIYHGAGKIPQGLLPLGEMNLTGPSSCTSYHNTTTLLTLRQDAGIIAAFALGEGSYHLGSLSSSGKGCLPKKLTMLSNKHA